jgi:hypothetical protein
MWTMADVSSILMRDAVRSPPVEGRLEGFVDGRVLGWAWSPLAPSERIWVAVFRDGEPVGGAMADMARSDLLAAGIGDGAHGFAIEIPAAPSNEVADDIRSREQTRRFRSLPDSCRRMAGELSNRSLRPHPSRVRLAPLS